MKKIAMLIIISAIIFCCIAPPWQKIVHMPRSNIKNFYPAGYGFLWDPPSNANIVDTARLVIQIGLLLFLGSCIVFSKYILPQTKPRPKTALPDEAPTKKKRKWIAKTLLCLFILVLLGYGTVMTIFYYEAEQGWSIWYERYKELATDFREKEQLSPQPTPPGRLSELLDAFDRGEPSPQHLQQPD